MKFIKIPAFAIVLLLLMQIVSKAFIAIDSSDIENIYGFYSEPKNSLDMVMIGPSEVYTGYAPALAWEEYGLKSCNLSIGAVAMQYVQVHRHGDCEETEAEASFNQCFCI